MSLKHALVLRIASLSGPIWDRADRVTRACRLKRVAACHDRRIGRMGDWTEHLCPCPSKLRWALPAGARRQLAKGGRTDRWPQMTAIRSRTILLIAKIKLHDYLRTQYVEPRTTAPILPGTGTLGQAPGPGTRSRANPSAPSRERATQPGIARWPECPIPSRSLGGGSGHAGTRPERRHRCQDRGGRTPPLGIPGLAIKR